VRLAGTTALGVLVWRLAYSSGAAALPHKANAS
jgi:hypothetical protein